MKIGYIGDFLKLNKKRKQPEIDPSLECTLLMEESIDSSFHMSLHKVPQPP